MKNAILAGKGGIVVYPKRMETLKEYKFIYKDNEYVAIKSQDDSVSIYEVEVVSKEP